MTTPEFLTRVSGGSWPSAWGMKHRSSPTGYEVYDLWTGTDWYTSTEAHSIKVDTATNIWYDGATTGAPTDVTPNGLNLELYENGTLIMTLVKPTEASWISSGGGPGTLGNTVDTASFAGTTVQQIQWSITNGSSPTPNSNYYLFSETPGGTAKGTINLGSNPQAGVTFTSTYLNPSGADFTGIWYVGYGQNATRVNLASYNFNQPKKVFCNFW